MSPSSVSQCHQLCVQGDLAVNAVILCDANQTSVAFTYIGSGNFHVTGLALKTLELAG